MNVKYFGLVLGGAAFVVLGLLAISNKDLLKEDYQIGYRLALLGGLGIIALGLVAAAVAFSVLTTARIRFYEKQEIAARGESDQALDDVSGPGDLLGLMRANRKQMNAYDALARSQAETSYRTSQAAMGLGLVLLMIGILIAVSADLAATKYAAAIITATGAAVGAYVARTFLAVQQKASSQMNYYFQQPLVQSYLLSAERLISQAPADRRSDLIEVVIASALSQIGEPVGHKGDSKRASKTRAGAPEEEPKKD